MPLLKEIKQNIKKYTNHDSFTLIREEDAYSNTVYKVVTDDDCYIYKEYKKKSDIEAKVLHALKREFIVDTDTFRIEKYYEFRKPNYLKDARSIGKSIKEFHQLRIDLPNFLEILTQMIHSFFKDGIEEQIIDKLYAKIKERYTLFTETVTVSHNDLQPGNILIIDDKAMLIDFEYASLNNPMFDYANIFCEMSCDYSVCELREELMPSEEEKRRMLEGYVNGNIDNMLFVANNLMCCSHFLWYLWARKYVKNTNDNSFNYLKYGISRLFFLKKENLIDQKEYEILKEKMLK
ncbi:hypothetical protein H312_02443 [Anncaliia algerae PRA339]|uniref:ethanolamine kinase n=1 Tax=Anncaliia algerae PRA339 TaxID=1288291 RepID=A0A059EZ32_9MICR|nr:hypothetical protein H312_02443 [Anncaliia algerae PRA339]